MRRNMRFSSSVLPRTGSGRLLKREVRESDETNDPAGSTAALVDDMSGPTDETLYPAPGSRAESPRRDDGLARGRRPSPGNVSLIHYSAPEAVSNDCELRRDLL
jgi:hypothetical protein